MNIIKKIKVGFLIVVISTIFFLSVACEKSSTLGKTKEVMIGDFNVKPRELVLKNGDSVKWVNKDSNIHTITIDNSAAGEDFDKTLDVGQSFVRKFNKIGEYPYHCNIHELIKGEIIVR